MAGLPQQVVPDVGGAKVLVFLGSLFGQTSPVPAYSALTGAEVTLAAGHWLDVRLDAGHEHGFLCDTGSLAAGGAMDDAATQAKSSLTQLATTYKDTYGRVDCSGS